MGEIIEKNYASPRWSGEIFDCSMPMSMDTYSVCSYNCLYCFSFFQRSHCVHGYLQKEARSVNSEKIKQMFTAILNDDLEKLNGAGKQFYNYVKQKKIMQWGGLSDQFDNFEKKHGITLELLKFFDEIDYPLSFSTKSVWWTEDKRYMDLFEKHKHNWHVKISIISLNADKCKIIEQSVETPQRRLQAIKNLSKLGIHVTLRLRPYIIGLSDDYAELIKLAHEAGADSISTEFFCLENRADTALKNKYAAMSKVLGYDLHKYYRENSKSTGYLRLNKSIKESIIKNMQKIAHSYNMRFHVSDAMCREYQDACNCCGVPPEWKNSQYDHFGNAILIAKEKGYVKFSDIKNNDLFNFKWRSAAGFNTTSNEAEAKYLDTTMLEFIRIHWNNLKSNKNPMNAYGRLLIPDGIDENGDIIYKYIGKKDV